MGSGSKHWPDFLIISVCLICNLQHLATYSGGDIMGYIYIHRCIYIYACIYIYVLAIWMGYTGAIAIIFYTIPMIFICARFPYFSYMRSCRDSPEPNQWTWFKCSTHMEARSGWVLNNDITKIMIPPVRWDFWDFGYNPIIMVLPTIVGYPHFLNKSILCQHDSTQWLPMWSSVCLSMVIGDQCQTMSDTYWENPCYCWIVLCGFLHWIIWDNHGTTGGSETVQISFKFPSTIPPFQRKNTIKSLPCIKVYTNHWGPNAMCIYI